MLTRSAVAAAGRGDELWVRPLVEPRMTSTLCLVVSAHKKPTPLQRQAATLHALHMGAPAGAAPSPDDALRALIRTHFDILLGPDSDFIPVMLYEWRSLTPAQRKGIARIKDSYEATWMPVLEALAQQGALQAEPGVARLFIFGALNWAVQWFSPKKGKSLDALTDEALALFIRS